MKVTKITKIVAYYRLSKPKKGKTKNETIRDAYGLEDQRREVARIAAEYDAQIIGEFVEGFYTLSLITPAVTFFGSARARPGEFAYVTAEAIGHVVA